MRRSSLSTAVVAGLAGVDRLDHCAIAPDALGQVLIYPHHTPHAGFEPLDDTPDLPPRAVKVRFLEGHSRNEVRDFNLYLSPQDMWTSKEPPR
jgi:hypothetical protein